MRGRVRSGPQPWVAGEVFVKNQEIGHPIVSGIEVESVVEVLGLSWSKVVVVPRSKQKFGAQVNTAGRENWCVAKNHG
jgi:hypothetical protein